MTPPTGNDLSPAVLGQWLRPDWAVLGVQGWCSTRAGAISAPPYDGFNTANHVGDDPESVARCRAALAEHFHWQRGPQWLQQVHGTDVVDACGDGVEREADAVYSDQLGQVCTLHTADCLPVFFAAANGQEVALAHAGWRGLAAGVLESTLARFQAAPAAIQVWLGPAISQAEFEVGDEVRAAFVSQNPQWADCFSANPRGRWQCDLYELARRRLREAGVQHICGGAFCTVQDPRFFSYRQAPVTGRLLSLLWIDPAQ